MTKCLTDQSSGPKWDPEKACICFSCNKTERERFFSAYGAASFYWTTITNNLFRPAQETGIDHNKPQTPATAGYGLHGNPPIEPI